MGFSHSPGQKRKSSRPIANSAFPPTADIVLMDWGFVSGWTIYCLAAGGFASGAGAGATGSGLGVVPRSSEAAALAKSPASEHDNSKVLPTLEHVAYVRPDEGAESTHRARWRKCCRGNLSQRAELGFSRADRQRLRH